MRVRTIHPALSLLAAALSLLIGTSAVHAQSRPISVADQRQTLRTVRLIETTSLIGLRSMTRIQANVDTLLNRLRQRGASDGRLIEVATFYQRSVTALRFRQAAVINREANKARLTLLSRQNHEDLLDLLESAREAALTDLANAEAEVNAAIDASLESLEVMFPEP